MAQQQKRRLIPIVDRAFQLKYTGIILLVAAATSSVGSCVAGSLPATNISCSAPLSFDQARPSMMRSITPRSVPLARPAMPRAGTTNRAW